MYGISKTPRYAAHMGSDIEGTLAHLLCCSKGLAMEAKLMVTAHHLRHLETEIRTGRATVVKAVPYVCRFVRCFSFACLLRTAIAHTLHSRVPRCLMLLINCTHSTLTLDLRIARALLADFTNSTHQPEKKGTAGQQVWMALVAMILYGLIGAFIFTFLEDLEVRHAH